VSIKSKGAKKENPYLCTILGLYYKMGQTAKGTIVTIVKYVID